MFTVQAHAGAAHMYTKYYTCTYISGVFISPKINISAEPVKMALHGTAGCFAYGWVLFLHDCTKLTPQNHPRGAFLDNKKYTPLAYLRTGIWLLVFH